MANRPGQVVDDRRGVPSGFQELPADAQLDPIPIRRNGRDPWDQFTPVGDDEFAQMAVVPEGFEELPADAAVQPARMDDKAIRARLTSLIQSQASRADIDAFLQSQGIDPAAVPNIDQALAAARQGREFGVRTVNETPEATAAPETAGQALYRGVGDVAAGVGDLLGIIGNPLNAGINYLTGSNLSTDLGETFRGWTGAPDPITDTERYLSAGARGAAAGLAGAGLGSLAGGAGGMTGYVARQVASNPAVDAVSGMTSGLGAEGGRDVAGTPGAIVGGLAGGIGGAVGAARAFATRVPAAVALGRDGRLTPEAYDMAMRAGTTEGDVLDAYARVRASGNRDTRSPAERQAAREAARNRPATTPDQQARLDAALQDPQTAPSPTAVPDLPAQTRAITNAIGERIPAVLRQDGSFVRRYDGVDYPIEIIGNEQIDGYGRSMIQVRGPEGHIGFVPKDEVFPASSQSPASEIPTSADNTPPTNAQGRYGEAQSEGINLTRGQAEQDFQIQNDENSLRVSATNEGEQARGFFRQQQEQIQNAITRFRSAFGEDAGNAADRGKQVRDAVRDLRDAGQEGVSRLYRLAEEAGGDALPLETDGIRNAATDVLISARVKPLVKKSIEEELARYGLIGEAAPMNEVGITRVTLDDGSTVSFRGQPRQLTAANAEDLRKSINSLYLQDDSRLSQSIKPAIDDALEAALAQSSDEGGMVGARYQAARAAHRQQRQTFNAKDIIDNLIAVKRGTETDVHLPERAIAQVLGAGKDGVSNLRRVKALLMSSNTPSSKQAWAAIQHQGLADIFDSAISRNVNHGNGQIGDVVSGAKLNSAIERFGPMKLRELLDQEQFNGLMKLRRIIGNATIPISGTVNPSGTATKILNFLKGAGTRVSAFVPGFSTVLDSGSNLLAKASEQAATRRTLDGILRYDGTPASARKIDQQAQEFVRQFVDAGKSGRFVPTSINLTRAPTERKR
ncbi:hypothetical protein [uncultured Sphingomonas sp.]|uniref:hypothetical protein n=1 Tax=uncultured Sphingomonas sp. TaxID=158754 RepID=UPI0025DC7682|nr:hypothetical protein [uncultured Sphingomonas sp.]